MATSKALITMMSEIIEIERAIVQNDGVLPPDLEAKFDLTQGDLRKKVDAYKVIMDAMDARADYFKSMADQMTHARKLFESQRQRLKENLKYTMTSMTASELEGYDWRWRLSRSKPKLVIDMEKLPAMYTQTVQETVPNRALIEGDLALGLLIEGVDVEESASLRAYVNTAARARSVAEVTDGE